MNDYSSYLAFLLIGILLILVDGGLVYRSGQALLQDMYSNEQHATAANRLTVALFHLVALGLLALIAIAPPAGSGPTSVITRLGIMLLILAAVHGAVMGVLSMLRRRQSEPWLRSEGPPGTAERHAQANHGVAPDVPTSRPSIAPDLDQR